MKGELKGNITLEVLFSVVILSLGFLVVINSMLLNLAAMNRCLNNIQVLFKHEAAKLEDFSREIKFKGIYD